MIILDTNQLLSNEGLDTPVLGILLAVANATGHSVALPSVVVEEFIAHYENDVSLIVQTIRKEVDRLRKLMPSWGDLVGLPLPASASGEHGRRLATMFDILPLPESAAEVALIREARRLRPASTKWDKHKPGSGARDAAIWITALEAAASSDQPVYFVSTDQPAFGRDDLHPELQAEADQAGLIYCHGIDAVLAQLAERRPDFPGLREQMAGLTVRGAAQSALSGIAPIAELFSTVERFVGPFRGEASVSDEPPDLELESDPSALQAYAVDESLWATGRITWSGEQTLTVRHEPGGTPQDFRVYFRVSSTMLAVLGSDGTVSSAEVVSRRPLQFLGVEATQSGS